MISAGSDIIQRIDAVLNNQPRIAKTSTNNRYNGILHDDSYGDEDDDDDDDDSDDDVVDDDDEIKNNTL